MVIGFSAMASQLPGLAPMRGLALATQFAPYPKVFCQATAIDSGEKFETFAATFTLCYQRADGHREELKITPEIYSRLLGPYNRRNVYGAVLAYGPALPAEWRHKTLSYALTNPGLLPTELGLPNDAHDFYVQIRSRSAGSTVTWQLGGKEVEDEL